MELATNRNMALACSAGAGLCLLASLVFQFPPAAAVSALSFLLALLFWKYGYLLSPWLTSSLGIAAQSGPIKLPPSQDVLIMRRGNSYLASVFLGIRLYDSSTDKDVQKRALLMEYFERAVSSVSYPVKICLLVSPLDTSKVEDELKSKRSSAELHHARALSSGKSHLADAARYKRQIASLDSILAKLSSGQKPMDLSAYVTATACGANEQEAVSLAKARAGEIKASFSTALNAELSMLSGEELVRCVQLESAIPSSGAALSGEFGG
jgi:hypothetical protein